jgi:hypothetical protein
MPRPLLEIWREQNRDREPSSLLTVPSHDALRRMQQSANMEGLRKFAETAPAREILVFSTMRTVGHPAIGCSNRPAWSRSSSP